MRAFASRRLQRTAAGDTTWTGFGGHAMLTCWEAGQFRTYDTFTPAEWRALGASLAALHLNLDRLHLPAPDTIRARLAAIDADDMRCSLLEALEHTPPEGDRALLRTYVDACLRMLDEHYPGSIDAFPAGDAQHPIHNDYNQFNYLFDGALPPVILDWEATIGAPREFEVVRCLNHLPLEAPELAAAFVSAYLQVRPLHPETDRVGSRCRLSAARPQALGRARLAERSAALRIASARRDENGRRRCSARARRLIDFFSRCLDAGRL